MAIAFYERLLLRQTMECADLLVSVVISTRVVSTWPDQARWERLPKAQPVEAGVCLPLKRLSLAFFYDHSR